MINLLEHIPFHGMNSKFLREYANNITPLRLS